MPAEFEIDLEHRLVRSRAWGVLVDADLAATQQALRTAPGFEPDFCQLYDFREVTQIKLTAPFLRRLAKQSPFARDARRAVVVSSDVAFGMARMYELAGNRDPNRFRIFRTCEEAIDWLGEDARPPHTTPIG